MIRMLAGGIALALAAAGGHGAAPVPGRTIAQAGAPTVAQQLVARFLAAHAELSGLELALQLDGGCRTVAASAPEDLGEKCDADELGPIRTGKPDVEAPSREDPVYDITQALHDASGRLIGAVGMDLKPDTAPTARGVLARARALLALLEREIPSKARLLESAAP